GATSATWSGSDGSSGSGALTDTIASLAPGASVTYTVAVQIDPAATGTLVDTATASAAADTTPGNNTASDTDTLTPQGDLAVTKTDGVSSAVPGTSVTYTVVVSNGGPSTATGVAVADAVPGALTGVTYTSTAAGGATGNTA